MLKLENSIRGLSFSRVAFDLTIQGNILSHSWSVAIDTLPTIVNIALCYIVIFSIILSYKIYY